jgi:F-type H+-transporting ATPase subunit a
MDQILHLLQIKEDIPSIHPHELFSFGPFVITSSTMMAFLAMFVFIFLAFKVSKFKMIPNFFQHLTEILVEFLVTFVGQIVGSREKGLLLLPYVGSVFAYILFSNLSALIPVINGLEWHGHHMFTPSTADFNTTFALALASVVIVHIVSISKGGLFSHLGHFIQVKPIIDGFKKSFGEGMLGIIHFFVGLIEVIGEVAKVISLSLRLFGNMFAHEVLMIILLGAFSIGIPALWMGMGILVGVVQAVVFTALITVYYSLLVREEAHH